jgi:hypothetical protein
VLEGEKSLIKRGWWLQNIHKYMFMREDCGWIVKDCDAADPAWAVFCL